MKLPGDHVARPCASRRSRRRPAVARDDVAGARRRPADRVARCSSSDDAVAAVAQGDGAGGVGADEVALDQVARRPRPMEPTPCRAVCRDDVAGAAIRPADRVAARRRDQHAVDAVAQGRPVPGPSVGADEVALDQVARRAAAPMSRMPSADVAGDDVAGAGGRPADRVARRVLDRAARRCDVAQAGRAGGVGADESCPHHVARRAGAERSCDAVAGRCPEMMLPAPRRRPADRVARRAVDERRRPMPLPRRRGRR